MSENIGSWANAQKENVTVETPERLNADARQKLRPYESKFMCLNFEYVMNEIQYGWAQDLSRWPQVKDEPALLIGSGPTTDRIMPYLKDWKGAIFCSTSQAITCLHHGAAVNIVLYDVQTKFKEFTRIDSWKDKEATLLLHPACPPGLVRFWRDKKKYYYLPYMPFDALREDVMPEAYDFIRSRVLMSGSTGGMQLVIARLLGYNPIFMAGLDFGYPFDQDRFTEHYFDHEQRSWVTVLPGKPSGISERDVDEWIGDKFTVQQILSDNGVPSLLIHVFYKTQFLKMARMDNAGKPKPQLIVATPGGIMDPVLPTVDCSAEEFVKTQGRGWEKLYRTNSEMIDAYDRYLVQHGAFPIPVPDSDAPEGKGVVTLDTEDWRKEVPLFIENQLKKIPAGPMNMAGMTARPDQIDTAEVMKYFEDITMPIVSAV
jgi:hypothetical protein|tara:strand:- start:232 stop:1518 length:1287 start_codon:yes stop_codon:yes gene_type:complete